ncbi:MAG: type II secretion system protein [Erysipelotrichaceae bacterium]
MTFIKIIREKKGFTLIELIIVIAILGVLALIIVPSFMDYIGGAHDAKDEENGRIYFTATQKAMADSIVDGKNFVTDAQLAVIRGEYELEGLQPKYKMIDGDKGVSAIWYKKDGKEGYYPTKEAFFDENNLPVDPTDPTPDPDPSEPGGETGGPELKPDVDPAPDPDAPVIPSIPDFNVDEYKEWKEGGFYKVGSIVQFDDELFVALKAVGNTDSPTTKPDAWKKITKTEFSVYDPNKDYDVGELLINEGQYIVITAKKLIKDPMEITYNYQVIKIK